MKHQRHSIAFFMHDLSGGGVERMRLRLAEALSQRGHTVTLVLQHISGPWQAGLPPGIRVVGLQCSGVFSSSLVLARFIRANRPEVLVSSLDHNNVAALCAGILSGVVTPVVICQHNALSAEQALGWKYRLVPLCYRLLAPWASAIVAVSYGVADDLAYVTGIDRRRIGVIFNPVVESSEHVAQATLAPHPWLDGAEPVFVFIGRLVAQKDPCALLAAFALRLRAGPARLLILGDGELRASMVTLASALGISSHIDLMGFVPNVAPFLLRAYALVVTSRYEGFGNVIVEALACGTPVIATDCPFGPDEILRHGQFGCLVAVGDTEALAAAMQRNLRQEWPAEKLRARAAAFSVAACAERHEALFGQIRKRRDRCSFGLRFTKLSAQLVAHAIATEPCHSLRLVVTPNIDHIRLLQRADFARAYLDAHIVCPDGFPVVLYAWLRSSAPLRRVAGCDVLHHLVRHAALGSRRVVVVAESAGTCSVLQNWLEPRGLAGRWSVELAPPDLDSDPAASAALAGNIAASAPDIIIMTLGAPVSEEFVHRHRGELPACWVLCFGQALKVELGLVQRAPRALRSVGFEWLWRVGQEPGRLAPRYVKAAAWFPRAIMRDLKRHTY